MTRRPHILWIAPFLPSPPHDGGRMRMHAMLLGLARQFRITLLTLIHHPVDAFAAGDLETAGVRVIAVVRRPSPVPDHAVLPGMVHPFYCDEFLGALDRIIAEDRPDAAQIEFLQMGYTAEHIPAEIPLIYTEHDASHLSGTRSYLPAGANGRAELLRRRGLLRKILKRASHTVTMSDADGEILFKVAPGAEITAIPMGVDFDHFLNGGRFKRIPGRILFVGAYAHYPNVDAARALRDMLPFVRTKVPQAHLVLAGSNPTPEIRSFAGPAVAVPGTLEDLRPEYSASSIFAAPIRLGAGMKTKLLEAFAAGVPVVALRQAVEGIPARHRTHSLIAKDLDQFRRFSVALLRDEKLRRRLSRNAKTMGRGFDWQVAVDAQAALYRRVLTAKILA